MSDVPIATALADGHLKMGLHSEKVTRALAITHTKLGGDDTKWMLLKVDDDSANRRRRPTSTQNESVLSGKTNDDVEED